MHKITGYALIFVGLMMMFFSLISMYKVFADRRPAVPVVQLADMNLNTSYGIMQIPMQNLNTLTNLGLFALFMLFVLSAGAKTAGIGCNLLKNERICEALLQLDKKTKLAAQDNVKKL